MARKITPSLLTLITLFSLFSFKNGYSQNLPYTAPTVTLNANFNGNLAALDFYGTYYTQNTGGNYGAIWGRGGSLNVKIGLGQQKYYRFVIAAEYNKMINDNFNSIPFFVINPDVPVTNYDIITGGIGVEYVTKPRCPERYYIGGGFTGNRISAPSGNVLGDFDPAFRFGMMMMGGYEYVFGQKGQFGINLGMRFNYINLFNSSSDTTAGSFNINDGPGRLDFKRKIAMLSINLGFVFTLGQKPIFLKQRTPTITPSR